MKTETVPGLMRKIRQTKSPLLPQITVRTAPGNRSRGLLQAGHLVFRAALGKSGTTVFKREGDGGTPVARMKILRGFRRSRRVRFAPSVLPLSPIGKDDLWCDQPGHAAYNRPVKAPFGFGHEVMTRQDGLYDICLVLDWNIRSRKRYAGSAIFFHLNHPGYMPTAGCISISRRDMLRLLPFIGKGTVLRVMK